MNPEIKAQWLAALRGGEYAQTTGVLNDGAGFCCLGVLCDLAVKVRVTTVTEDARDNGGRYRYGGWEWVQLPPEVAEWAGLDSKYPGVEVGEDGDGRVVQSTLADLNDRGTPFAEIADLIEEQL